MFQRNQLLIGFNNLPLHRHAAKERLSITALTGMFVSIKNLVNYFTLKQHYVVLEKKFKLMLVTEENRDLAANIHFQM